MSEGRASKEPTSKTNKMQPIENFMKKTGLIVGYWFMVINLYSQNTVEGISPVYQFSISKEIKPPVLNMDATSITFIDQNGNHAIDANENCTLKFSLGNTGYGDGIGLTARVSVSGTSNGVSFSQSTPLPIIKIGETKAVEIPVKSDLNTIDGSVTFTLQVDEPNGFGVSPQQIEVQTRKFISPMIEIADYSITSQMSGNLRKKLPFDLQVLVQNTQYGAAEDVRVSLGLPPEVICISSNTSIHYDKLNAGEKKDIVYTLIVSDNYVSQTIPVHIKISEKYGKFSKDKDISLTLNQSMAVNKLVVEADKKQEQTAQIIIGSLSSDVDKAIPQGPSAHPERYALIIGNEDYSSFQSGLSTESNVDFAANDARIFRDYIEQTLGVPKTQIKLLTNATAGQINQSLAWIAQMAKVENGNAELLFYYSGHGLPDENSHEPYLIPVDVSGTNIQQAIRLSAVYQKLSEFPSKRITVFLDACFSGGARNQSLIAMKSVKVKPAEFELSGNMVVFSSSTGEETSNVYREKQHGFFTYFLLKELQSTKGDITYKQLADYLRDKVLRGTSLISKPQTPMALYSESARDQWENWKME